MPLALLLLRRALPTAVAALLGAASTAGAQLHATAAYAPSCGPGTPCTLVRVTFENAGASSLLFNTLTLGSLRSTFRFAPAAGGTTLYQAVDAIGPFGGSGVVAPPPGAAQLFIDFLGGNGFAFELAPGTSGYVEVPLVQAPAFTRGPFAFAAALDGGGTVVGTTTPEPATVALVGGGLALAGLAGRRSGRRPGRRRRRA